MEGVVKRKKKVEKETRKKGKQKWQKKGGSCDVFQEFGTTDDLGSFEDS